jgi:aerobic-type carbon monoxide dehydrogenase small subunit (CoxS/CutS family)
MTSPVRFTVNGRSVSLADDGSRTLLWALRTDLDLTGPKYGCGEGHCGACTVLVDGAAERSCSVQLKDVAGKHVTTIEGLAEGGKLHPLQQAFIDHGAFQCGYCTSGMLLTAVAFLKDTPHPTKEQIVSGMEHNLCRCAAHQRIVAAIAQVGGAQ